MIILTDPFEIIELVRQKTELEFTIDLSDAIPEGELSLQSKAILATMVWFPLIGDESIKLNELLGLKRGDKRIFVRKPTSVIQFECEGVWLGDVLNSIRSSGVKVHLFEKVGNVVKRQWAYNEDDLASNEVIQAAMDCIDDYLKFLPHLDERINIVGFSKELIDILNIKNQYNLGEVDSEHFIGSVVAFNRHWVKHVQHLRDEIKGNANGR